MSSPDSQSPPRPQVSLTHESPVHAKIVHSSRSYQNGLLEDARLAVLEDLGSSIPEITFQTFMDFLAPPQPDFDLNATMKLLKSGSSRILSTSRRWIAFDKEPKEQAGREDAVFQPLTDIFKKVVDAIIANSKLKKNHSIIDFLQNPNMEPKSADRHNATRPDGYLLAKDRVQPGIVSWADVVLSCEYKREDGDEELDDDVRKCVWSMQHVMRDDPCRRATFGMTIENSTTRVWFCCRSSVIVSEAFNFIAEPEALVKLFASFAFADKKSLGFDSTIVRIPGEPKQFFITVHPDNDDKSVRRFRTKKIISSFGAEPLRGRGTRVFEAIEIDKHGKETNSAVVVKDIWIDHDRTREGAILAELHRQADNEDKKLVEKFFLTTICHGDVWTEPGVLDDTENGLMRGLKLSTGGTFELQRKQLVLEKQPIPPGSEGLRAISRLPVPHPHLKYAHKTHYRIVFKEKGVTLDLVPSIPDVMTILTDTVSALQLLRKLGWVHRDVSIGNILSCEGGAKLADLEYAKRVGDVKSHEMRTGTLHFMSIEVAAQQFLFGPHDEDDNFTEFMQSAEMSKQNDIESTAVPFSHNHVHDLESLWWVAVWMIFYNHFSKSQQSGEEPLSSLLDAQRQLELAGTLFPTYMKSIDRRDGFQRSFLKTCGDLPSSKKAICAYLNALRRVIIRNYVLIESKLPQTIDLNASMDDIYEKFNEVFATSKEKYADFSLAFIPDIHAQLRVNLKRARAESTNDTGIVTQKRK